MRTPLALAGLVLALALTACGNDTSDNSNSLGDKAFGELSAGDLRVMGRISATGKRLPHALRQLTRGDEQQNAELMRQGVDEYLDIAGAIEDAVLDIDNSKLRASFGDYASAFGGLADALDAYVTYYETPGDADQAAEAEINRSISDAGRTAERAQRAFINQLLDSASPEQRKELRSTLRAFQAKLNSATGG